MEFQDGYLGGVAECSLDLRLLPAMKTLLKLALKVCQKTYERPLAKAVRYVRGYNEWIPNLVWNCDVALMYWEWSPDSDRRRANQEILEANWAKLDVVRLQRGLWVNKARLLRLANEDLRYYRKVTYI